MRLKKIEPEMAIHCKNDEEKRALLEEAERLGYVWYGSELNPTEKKIEDTGNTIHFYDAGDTHFSVDYKHITHSGQVGRDVIEFSDLILPELTAEEALRIYFDITDCGSRECELCPLSSYSNSTKKHSLCNNHGEIDDEDIKEIVEICQQWKSDHEKKEPEIETVDICRIIEIQPNGFKKCVHEEDMDSQTIAETEDILKRYCMEHKGEFIAVHEVVSRVKAVD